jgi:SAM-dependent methyltransferase/uncharacterized protein YbaR (Trm112 family)
MWEFLVCPRDKQALVQDGTMLVCPHRHRYSVVDGIPVLLVSETRQAPIESMHLGARSSQSMLEVGLNAIDPFVCNAIVVSSGDLYRHLVGNLTEYPLPHLRLPAGENKSFLEVGCNWGRWCIAAARSGYRPVGIDPSLNAIRAAIRVAKQLRIDATFIVADGRHLPFRDHSFDQVFAYNVVQHLSKEDARCTLGEIRRTLKINGNALVQMPNMFGIRSLYHQGRRGFRQASDYEVRYWKRGELLSAFSSIIGPCQLSVDGYFSLNVQSTDLHLLPYRYRVLVRASEHLRQLSHRIPLLARLADSLYVSARRVE